MKRLYSFLLFIIVLKSSFSQIPLNPVWDNGLKFKSADGSTSIGVGGRVHYDVAFTSHDKELDSIAGDAADKLEVRRARLSFEGRIKKSIKYEFEFTFGEQVRFADMYVAFLKVPFFEQLTVGHFREPFGMEENTSSNSIVFMERSLTSAFGPGRNAGLMVQKLFLEEKLRIYAGAFRVTNSLGSDLNGEGKHSFSARAAYLPVRDTSRNEALHVGLSTNIYATTQNTYQLNIENETHTGGTFIKSGRINDVSSIKNYGSEIGYTLKRFYFQSEYMHSFTKLNKVSDSLFTDRVRDFNSYYAMASWFFGKGKRSYSSGGNKFSSISVDRSNTADPYKGVWEVGIRFSRIFLKESIEEIKKMSDVTLGLNWYYNENSRIMFNYILSRIQNRYNANAFQTRFQITF